MAGKIKGFFFMTPTRFKQAQLFRSGAQKLLAGKLNDYLEGSRLRPLRIHANLTQGWTSQEAIKNDFCGEN